MDSVVSVNQDKRMRKSEYPFYGSIKRLLFMEDRSKIYENKRKRLVNNRF